MLNSYFNSTIYLISLTGFNTIQFNDHLVVAYFLGHPVVHIIGLYKVETSTKNKKKNNHQRKLKLQTIWTLDTAKHSEKK